MDETKEVKPSEPVKQNSLIDKAIAAAERLEAANKRSEELLKNSDDILTRSILGGHSIAGTTQVKAKTEKETIQEEADEFIKKYSGH